MFRSLTSIAVGATAAASLLVAPAVATQVTPTPEANGLSTTTSGDEPEIINLHTKDTLTFGKKEVCKFPVAIKLNVRNRYVITNGGDDVVQTNRGHIKVTNLWTKEHLHLKVRSKAFVKVDREDNISGVAYGKDVWFNVAPNSLKIKDPEQGHVSRARRGAHQVNEGIHYVVGKAKFRVEGVSSATPEERVYVKRGHVLDVCKALAGHRKHH
jgi:hypothetical protein